MKSIKINLKMLIKIIKSHKANIIHDLRYYPDGTLIHPKLPQAYGLPAENPQWKCGNCKFRHNNYCSYWQAQIRNEYWCASYKNKVAPNFTTGYWLYQGYKIPGEYAYYTDPLTLLTTMFTTRDQLLDHQDQFNVDSSMDTLQGRYYTNNDPLHPENQEDV